MPPRNGTRSRHARSLILGVAIAATLGCAGSSQLTRVWHEPGYADGPVSHVLVVALRPDPIRRRQWEDGFAAALARREVRVTPSYAIWATAVPDTQQVIQAVRDSVFDAVISLMRLPDDTVTVSAPGRVQIEPVTYQMPWYDRYAVAYRTVSGEATTATERRLNFQSDLWRVVAHKGRLVWSGAVSVSEARTGHVVTDAVERSLAPAIAAAGLLPTPAPKP